MKNRRKREKNLFILVCLLPALILFFTFLILPNDSSIPHVHVQMGRILKQSTICWIG